jgi:glucoamylase
MPLVYRNAASVLGLAPPNIATYQSALFGLMLRNVATTGWVLIDPSGNRSQPGAIIASPSFPANTTDTTQNYVYNWARDAAITAFEVAAAPAPWTGIAAFDDYVSFAQTCQAASVEPVPISRACYYINGTPRDWSNQNDGPALQTMALLALWPNLSAGAQATARQVIQANITYLLANANYAKATTNLWEEAFGLSFFAQSVILQCFTDALAQNTPLALALDTGSVNAALSALRDPVRAFRRRSGTRPTRAIRRWSMSPRTAADRTKGAASTLTS